MLKVENISLYYGAAQALRGVSIAAEPGKVTCVLGRNGVGKTSLLRAMVGQYPIASGSITLNGDDITGIQPSLIKAFGRAISYWRSLGNMAIVLVEQYRAFACELGDTFAVMDRGAVKYACDRSTLDPAEISRQMAL